MRVRSQESQVECSAASAEPLQHMRISKHLEGHPSELPAPLKLIPRTCTPAICGVHGWLAPLLNAVSWQRSFNLGAPHSAAAICASSGHGVHRDHAEIASSVTRPATGRSYRRMNRLRSPTEWEAARSAGRTTSTPRATPPRCTTVSTIAPILVLTAQDLEIRAVSLERRLQGH